MLDAVYAVGTVVFFAVMVAFVRGLAALGRADTAQERGR